MSYDIKLKVFTLRLKKSRAKKDPNRMWSEVFNLYEGNEQEKFNAFFKAYLESFEGKFITYKNWPKAITVPELDVHFKSKERLFYGQFEGGPTNQTFRVKNLDNTGEGLLIEKNQVTSSPFYFIFHIPENSNLGLLIVQSMGEIQMHDILQLNFQLFVKNLGIDVAIDYNEKITKEAIESYKKGNIKSITIRKSGLSKDIGDHLFTKKYQDYGDIKIELKVSFMDRLSNALLIDDIKKSVLGKNPQIFEIAALETLGIDEQSDVFAKFEHKGRETTAKVEDGVKLSPIYHVDSSDVPLDVNNHPHPTKMKEYLLSFMNKMIIETGLNS
ncbi:hypothetical protein [Pedobacter sp. ASV28]|uniref:hypothetical protein n=1 Tax=Pedobacter sp. ASV28 TaxID=2795123 RepID=UPI0018ECFEA0|nr:hypothetical protein [Pedobacter sp. ASV28]